MCVSAWMSSEEGRRDLHLCEQYAANGRKPVTAFYLLRYFKGDLRSAAAVVF